MKLRPAKLSLAILLLSSILVTATPAIVAAADLDVNPATTSLANGIMPACDPGYSDLKGGTIGPKGLPACGVTQALQLIYNIIKYVTYIIIPIAVLLIGYAGFTIMTSAGEAEKISQAKHMIQLLAIGIAIILLSTLIVQYVFKAVGVQSTNITNITPGAK